MPRSRYTGPPATLANMPAQGVRSIAVHCWACGHDAVLSADRWPDDVPAPWLKPRMVCTSCGIIGDADVRPNWKERPDRPTLTGMQWH